MSAAFMPTHATRYDSQIRPVAIARWLLVVAVMVFLMVVIGGITRLTESGLSITEWRPFSGAIPPLSHADWVEEFEKYKQIPEYILVNGPAGMTLDQFKFIFFWEWAHRQFGRIIGLAYAAPLAWFWLKQAIPAGYKPRLLALLALGAGQATIGWWMVASGLSERTDVSHYRLAVHLLTALVILGGLVWTALDLRRLARDPAARPAAMQPLVVGCLAALFVQILYGAWVAGLNAGYVASDWPLMQGRFWPDGIDWSRGLLFAFTHDPFLLHFIHRWWAWGALAALIILARMARPADRRASAALNAALGVQVILGIATVWSGVALWLAVLHQAIGALVVVAAVWCAHVAGRRAAVAPAAG